MKHTTLCRIALALSASALVLTSCGNDYEWFPGIFYEINHEVALEKYGIVGDVSGFVQHGDCLYVNSGRIYKKTATPSGSSGKYNQQWSRAGSEPGTMFGLASDGTYLYSICIRYDEDTSAGTNTVVSRTLYCSTDGSDWKEVTGDTGGMTAIMYDRAAGKAYALKSSKADSDDESVLGLYALNGGAVGAKLSGSDSSARSVAHGTAFTGASVYSESNATYYHASGSDIYCGTTGSTDGDTKVSPGIGTVRSLALTSDYLLVGTNKGIYRLRLDGSEKTPASSPTDFEDNAQSMLSSAYEVPLLFVLDPAKIYKETDSYAATNISGSFSSSSHATFANVGLYAYYPGRKTWNKDGTADGSTSPKGN